MYLFTTKNTQHISMKLYLSLVSFLVCFTGIMSVYAQHRGDRQGRVIISGRVVSSDNGTIDLATIHLEGTPFGARTDGDGHYTISAPEGEYTISVSALGYKDAHRKIKVGGNGLQGIDFKLSPDVIEHNAVTVTATGVVRVKRSAYNAIAIDTRGMQNTTKNLSDALAAAPGVKLRESGGVGSDKQLMVDGFSGKHVKVFIYGVPQEGVGSSFGLNNIPVSFARRIEVYKGVVPVGFGTDALGGVINIVTEKQPRRWFADASYSYGSFNTHKSYVHFGQALKNGFTYEVNAFQNYSDNDYRVDAPVKNFDTGSFNEAEKVRVRRFHDNYHNEAVVAKAGVTGKPWADRLMVGLTYSHMYKDIQTGVRQKTVFGEKHRYGHSLMPSLEYSKRNLLVEGLNVVLTANYNRNSTVNVDTARYQYNWLGERHELNSPGEQSYFILPELQVKLSYEKAYRLPTIEEMFGDEDLESGDIGIRPENSDNLNLNISWSDKMGDHSLYAEGSLVFRDTKDYIQRNVQDLSGGRENATYTNYGKVLTKGYNLSVRYMFRNVLSVGGNFTQMDVRDNEKYQIGTAGGAVENLGYKARISNVPYRFADYDVTFYWHRLGGRGNLLTLTYDSQYTHRFSYYPEIFGNVNDFYVPKLFAHNLTLSYSMKEGRYNFSLECRNFTNEKLYDNFSLQKAGRAFYAKFRVSLGG